MSDWQQVGDSNPTPDRARARPVTPATSEHNNYYDGLTEFNSDSDPDSTPSESLPLLPTDFWEDEDIIWEEIRQEHLPHTTDLEEEVTFISPDSSDTPSLQDSFNSGPETKSDLDDDDDTDSSDLYITMTDYKSVRELMEAKAPGSTTPKTDPTTVQLLHFKKTLVSALTKCSLNASHHRDPQRAPR